jgi:hypothetical protein
MNKLFLLPLAILLCAPFPAQDYPKGMSPPPAPMNPDNRPKPTESPTLSRHVDLRQLQQEADDLARTAQTIPSDVASVRQGVLPKDIVQKLKQIEKMSKHLRSELNP